MMLWQYARRDNDAAPQGTVYIRYKYPQAAAACKMAYHGYRFACNPSHPVKVYYLEREFQIAQPARRKSAVLGATRYFEKIDWCPPNMSHHEGNTGAQPGEHPWVSPADFTEQEVHVSLTCWQVRDVQSLKREMS